MASTKVDQRTQDSLLRSLLTDSMKGKTESTNTLMMMFLSPGLLGTNPIQASQIRSVTDENCRRNYLVRFTQHAFIDHYKRPLLAAALPRLVLNPWTGEKSKKLMMHMIMDPNADLNVTVPLLLMEQGYPDLESLFLLTTMMQNNCNDTNQQINSVLPHLLKADSEFTDSANKNLKTMLLLQIMSEGKNGLDMSTMLPFIMMDDQSEDDHLLRMVLINSILGEMDTTEGFDNDFNQR